MSGPPQAVLAEALREALDGATLRAAVLTTFTLEGGFTLDEVLPVFVPHALSAAVNTRREELAEHLLANGAVVTVYADAAHVGGFERASRVPMSVVPVTHPTGYFHPKVIMALTESEGHERFVLAVGSANLTQSGWWEWVECAHVLTLEAGARTWLKDDLLSFLEHLDGHSLRPDDRVAASRIRTFLSATKQRSRRSASDASGMTRFVWNGADGRPSLLDDLSAFAGDWARRGTLEILSPWHSDTGDSVARALGQRLAVGQTIALVPTDRDGAARLPSEAVQRLGADIVWGDLPIAHVSSGAGPDAAPRNVHAKVYRITQRRQRGQQLVIGSYNLTEAAFNPGGNLEAALLVDLEQGGQEPWLTPRAAPTSFHAVGEEDADAEVASSSPAPIEISYDWEARRGEVVWLDETPPASVVLRQGPVVVLELASSQLHGELSPEHSEALRRHLTSSSSFLAVFDDQGNDRGYVLVHESGVRCKPSADVDRRLSDALADLLLGVEARRARSREADLTEARDLLPDGDQLDDGRLSSAFDSYAALYQALAAFEREIRHLVSEGRSHEVAYRLTGEGARCLGDVLTTAERAAEQDEALALVVSWGVEQCLLTLRPVLADHHAAASSAGARADALRAALERRLLETSTDEAELARFLAWARRNFVGEAS